MPKDYLSQPYHQVRRADRAIEDDAWIKAFLHRAPMAALATVMGEQPFINANLFVYDEAAHVIYMHTAHIGRTRANIEQAEQICLSVSEMGRLLPASIAREFSVEYNGVVIFGSAKIVSDSTEAKYGLQLLLDKYFPHLQPGEDYRAITMEELKSTSVYRIDIDKWSGKQKKVAEDFAGAFLYNEWSTVSEVG